MLEEAAFVAELFIQIVPFVSCPRFMYDLFRAVAEATGFAKQEACGSKWEDLSGKPSASLSPPLPKATA